jgi:hypothetical protein
MKDNRYGSHSVTRLTAHLVWVTKYRYPVLRGDTQKRCRELLIQICDAEDVRILKGVMSKDHVHMHIALPDKSLLPEKYCACPKSYYQDIDSLESVLNSFSSQYSYKIHVAADGNLISRDEINLSLYNLSNIGIAFTGAE